MYRVSRASNLFTAALNTTTCSSSLMAAVLTAIMCPSSPPLSATCIFQSPAGSFGAVFLGGQTYLATPKQSSSNPASSTLKTIGFCMAAEVESGEQSSWAGSGEQSPGTPTTDLLSRFGVSGCGDPVLIDGVSEGELELSLSLRGCFEAGLEKNQVVRALSISGLSMHHDGGDVQPIVKMCSHPMESEEEEVRKRKPLQSLKRQEVKWRRFEKRESRTGAKHDSDRGAADRSWSISQRSAGSQGNFGLSDFDYRLEHGSSRCKEVKTSPMGIPLTVNQANIIIPIIDKQSNKMFNVANTIISIEKDKQSKQNFDIADKANELERSKLEGKLCVSAQGDGPNGRMIQGLLYKYGNGVDVKIVCVCHGSFLTPAEFVKHVGGGDVTHPLRHIGISRRRPPFVC